MASEKHLIIAVDKETLQKSLSVARLNRAAICGLGTLKLGFVAGLSGAAYLCATNQHFIAAALVSVLAIPALCHWAKTGDDLIQVNDYVLMLKGALAQLKSEEVNSK